MAQTVAIVRNTLTATGAGTTDFTKTGFGTPTAAIIVLCNANSTNNPEADAVLSVGLWDGTNQRTVGTVDDDNAAALTIAGRNSDDSFGAIVRASTGPPNEAEYTVSAVTDGIRLTLSLDNTTLQRFCTVILLAGVSAKALTFTPNGTQNATTESASLGFAPKLVFFTCIGGVTADFDAEHAIISFGCATNSTHRMLGFGSIATQPFAGASLLYSETRCVGQVFNSLLTWSGEVTTFGSDTFTMTTRDGASGGDVCFALALGGADLSFDCGTITTRTTTGDTVVSTSVSPDAILLALSTATGTSLHTDANANGMMVGMADDDGEFSHNFSIEDGADVTNCNSVAKATQILDLDSSSGGSRTDLCDATATLNASDFTLNYSVVDGTARKGFWVAFGPVASAATPATFTHHANFRFGQYGFVRPLRWWASQSRAVWQRLCGRGSSG